MHLAIVCMLAFLYAWVAYNVPVLIVGFKHLRNFDSKRRKGHGGESFPSFSIIVAARNEEKVVRRLLQAFVGLDYPAEKKELVISEDGSSDKTAEICARYSTLYPDQIRLVHSPQSEGKPAALNYALKHVRGEVVGVLDADSVPEPDMLLTAARYFVDSTTAAVQGKAVSVNAAENFLTRITSLEEEAKFDVYLRGKDRLGLYLPLAGSCQFIRKDVLMELGGWNADSLAEDVEISAALTKTGKQIKYAPEVRAWQESPSSWGQLVRQRARWYRGWIDVAAKYGRLVLRPCRATVDAEITLITPFILPLSLLMYLAGALSLTLFPNPLIAAFLQITLLFNVTVLLLAGASLFYLSGRKAHLLSWLFWICVYWGLNVLISSYALLKWFSRRPQKWNKTPKTGTMTSQLFLGLNVPRNPRESKAAD